MELPAGRYHAEWIDPESAKVVRSETVEHSGGLREFVTPVHAVDIALRLRKR